MADDHHSVSDITLCHRGVVTSFDPCTGGSVAGGPFEIERMTPFRQGRNLHPRLPDHNIGYTIIDSDTFCASYGFLSQKKVQHISDAEKWRYKSTLPFPVVLAICGSRQKQLWELLRLLLSFCWHKSESIYLHYRMHRIKTAPKGGICLHRPMTMSGLADLGLSFSYKNSLIIANEDFIFHSSLFESFLLRKVAW